VRELGLGGGRERRLLVEQLTRMEARGELKQPEKGLWMLPRREEAEPKSGTEVTSGHAGKQAGHARSGRDRLVSGRLDLHRDGFGFVRPDAASGVKEDIFIPPNEINGAMQGDVVLVDEAPPGSDGRRSGRIARVLTRRNPTVVGIFHYARKQHEYGSVRGNFVTPTDDRVASAISIADGDEVIAAKAATPHRTLGDEARRSLVWEPKDPRHPLEGIAVDVEILSFPSAGRPATGRVIEVLGPPDAFGVDVEIIIRKHHIPHAFPAPVLLEAEEQSRQAVSTLAPDANRHH
jgi:ribonuclease R